VNQLSQLQKPRNAVERVGLDNSLVRLDESQGIRSNEYNKVGIHLRMSGQCWDMLETKYRGMARYVSEKAENAVHLLFILEKEPVMTPICTPAHADLQASSSNTMRREGSAELEHHKHCAIVSYLSALSLEAVR
jgi:hypothetical protein